MKRNFKVDCFNYDGDTLVLWKSVYFHHSPSLQWLYDQLNDYDSVTISKVY